MAAADEFVRIERNDPVGGILCGSQLQETVYLCLAHVSKGGIVDDLKRETLAPQLVQDLGCGICAPVVEDDDSLAE